jgi:acetyl esterase/lipase
LIATLASVLLTYNALRPARRWWPLVAAGFFASWIIGEFALHHIFWQALVVAAFIWGGALDAWPGWVALGVAILSWVGLILIAIEAGRARHVMETSLREGLTEGYRDVVATDLLRTLDTPWSLRQRALPMPIYDSRVERIRNIPFESVPGVTLRLDVYRPRGRSERHPTILHVHGGAWMVGSKEDQGKPLAYRLAALGWVVVSANYRLSPRATFPDHIIDVKAAIRWIREHGSEHGADPDFLVITGGSAGGHLAALAALTPNDPEYQPGFEDVDTTVQACVPFYGVYDFTDRSGIWKGTLLLPLLERWVLKKRLSEAREVFDRASPMSRVRADAPPFLVVHGTRDTLVPVREARAFVELLRAVSRAPVLYAEVPGAQHAFEVFPSARALHVLAGVERFLAWVYTKWREQPKAVAAPPYSAKVAAHREAGREDAALEHAGAERLV